METNLDAVVRDASRGKSGARKVRASGRLPAVLYGRDAQSTPVDVDPFAFQTLFRKTQNRNTVVNLQMGGESIPCLVRDVQRHPVSREIIHVDFYRLEAGQEVQVDVPIRSVGKPRGATMGGRLRVLIRTVPVRCAFEVIPEALIVDVTRMNVGDMVKVSEIAPPAGVQVLYEQDYNVLTVYGKRSEALDLGETEEEGAEAEGEAEAAEETE